MSLSESPSNDRSWPQFSLGATSRAQDIPLRTSVRIGRLGSTILAYKTSTSSLTLCHMPATPSATHGKVFHNNPVITLYLWSIGTNWFQHNCRGQLDHKTAWLKNFAETLKCFSKWHNIENQENQKVCLPQSSFVFLISPWLGANDFPSGRPAEGWMIYRVSCHWRCFKPLEPWKYKRYNATETWETRIDVYYNKSTKS